MESDRTVQFALCDLLDYWIESGESRMHCLVNDTSHGRLFCMSIVANVCGTFNHI